MEPPQVVAVDGSKESSGFLVDNALSRRLTSLYNGFSARREALGLSNPGAVENISKEVQRDVLLTNHTFTGMRADIVKTFSLQPGFRVFHNLVAGSPNASPYSFGTSYNTSNVTLQGNVDSDKAVSGHLSYRISPALSTKATVQLAGATSNVFSFDTDYAGSDFMATLKSVNPSILEGSLTGIFALGYMQSVTPRLSLGVEGFWQRMALSHGPESSLTWAARYKGDGWIASAQLPAQGGLQASYWRRLMDKVEVGTDVVLQFAGLNSSSSAMMGGPPAREGLATIGAKYEFRTSLYRAQVDSQGRVGCYLEKRVAPTISLLFSGEIDHAKNATKVGLAVSIESATEEIMEQSEKLATEGAPIPF